MCQCGCGDTYIDRAFKIDRGPTVAYQLYRGCGECHPGIGVMLSFFNREGAREWVRGSAETIPVKPDDSGGNCGEFNIPIFEVSDLVAASEEMGPSLIGKKHGYANLQDWLEDNGLELIQTAIRKAQDRRARNEAL